MPTAGIHEFIYIMQNFGLPPEAVILILNTRSVQITQVPGPHFLVLFSNRLCSVQILNLYLLNSVSVNLTIISTHVYNT
jgi:hypothetical protein